MDGARERGGEGASGVGREQRSEGEEQCRKGDREGKLQGRYLDDDIGQYTAHKTTPNAALAIATLVLQIQNCKRVYKLCIGMRRNIGPYCLTGG